jgi:hypothetical protein
VEWCLPSILEALSPISSIAKKEKNRMTITKKVIITNASEAAEKRES